MPSPSRVPGSEHAAGIDIISLKIQLSCWLPLIHFANNTLHLVDHITHTTKFSCYWLLYKKDIILVSARTSC
jgi:hypothetical protein